MDATCTIQDSIHVFSLVHKYVSRILGTYQIIWTFYERELNPIIVFICLGNLDYRLKSNSNRKKMV